MAIADNQIVHPAFVDTPRRSISVAATTTQILTGRWVIKNSSGNAVYPTTLGMPGAYWVLEGTIGHVGTAAEFTSALSTNYITYPSNSESKSITGVYGSFVASVGPEGVNPNIDSTPTGNYAVGTALTVDTYGRLVPVTDTTTEEVYAIVESLTSATISSTVYVTGITFRAVGAQGSVGTGA